MEGASIPLWLKTRNLVLLFSPFFIALQPLLLVSSQRFNLGLKGQRVHDPRNHIHPWAYESPSSSVKIPVTSLVEGRGLASGFSSKRIAFQARRDLQSKSNGIIRSEGTPIETFIFWLAFFNQNPRCRLQHRGMGPSMPQNRFYRNKHGHINDVSIESEIAFSKKKSSEIVKWGLVSGWSIPLFQLESVFRRKRRCFQQPSLNISFFSPIIGGKSIYAKKTGFIQDSTFILLHGGRSVFRAKIPGFLAR